MTRRAWTRGEVLRLLHHLQALRFAHDFTGAGS